MIYLDHAATSCPKPPEVAAAMMDAMNTYGNPSRGAHEAALNALRGLMEARREIADFFGAQSPMQVAFACNATTALNTAIGGIKGRIVTTAADHNSVLRPVYRRGNYHIVSVDEKGRLDLNQLEEAITTDVGAVVMTHASNVTGNVFDIAAVGDICRRKRVRLIVDAAQSAGLLPFRQGEWGVSAVCFSGHKSLCGPQGTGGICLGDGFQPEPLAVGGSGSDSFSMTQPASLPDALEAGTQNAHGIAGLLAGLRHVKVREGACFDEADALARYFVDEVRKIKGMELYGDLDAPIRTPVVSLNWAGMDSAALAFMLGEQYDIAVRAGAHCAPLMHEALGTRQRGAVRFSFSHMNSRGEVDAALDALRKIGRD